MYINKRKGEIGNPLRPLAGGVPVKRNGFTGFIKCLIQWLPECAGSLFFLHLQFAAPLQPQIK